MIKKSDKFSLTSRMRSFKFGWSGLKTLFKEEHNARIHLVATFFVIILGLVFDISLYEWISILIIIGLVFACEILNSAIENICDLVSSNYNDHIKKAKDLGAAATLLTALIAVVIGLIIFIPKVADLF